MDVVDQLEVEVKEVEVKEEEEEEEDEVIEDLVVDHPVQGNLLVPMIFVMNAEVYLIRRF
jgi:glutaredoxin